MLPLDPRPVTRPAGERSSTAWRVFVLVSGLLLPLMVAASFDFGVTFDEKGRHRYGELVLEFLRGLRSRNDFLDPTDLGHLYGGLFDTICAAVELVIPADRYVIRHVLNAVVGWAGIVFAGRLGARLFGGWAGVLTLVLLAASPRYFADSMNNPKDLPVAVTGVVTLYYLSTVSPIWPYLSWRTAAKIALAVAVGLNVRAGTLIYLGYLGLLVAGYTIAERSFQWRRMADTACRLMLVTAAALVLGTVFWPWAQVSPLVRPIQALRELDAFPHISDMLYAGGVVRSNALPWHYVPWWFLITTPPVVLAGAALSLLPRGPAQRWRMYAIWGVVLFPIGVAILSHTILYDGIRHLLFVYPPLAVASAAGWAMWLSAPPRAWMRGFLRAALIAGLAQMLVFHVRSYPNQAAYFNGLVGGPRGAFARYDMDYWGNCILEGVEWSARTAQLSGMPLIVSGDPSHLVELDGERFKELYFVPPYRGTHHLDVRLARGSAEGVTGLATRPDTLYKVQTADGAVLCVVTPGPGYAQVKSRLVTPEGSRPSAR